MNFIKTARCLLLIGWGSGALVLGSLFCQSAAANDTLSNKAFGISAIAGFPEFLGMDICYLGWSFIVPGISFGSIPIQAILNNRIPLNPIAINFSLPDSYSLLPSANFSLYSFTAYLKFFLPNSGFYFELLSASLTAGANVGGDLKDNTTSLITYGLANGSASLNQVIIGLATGYRVIPFSSFFIEAALGAGYLLRPTYQFSIGGSATSVIGVIPNGEQAFDSAKAQIQSAFDSAIANYRASVKILPFTFINIGFMF